MENKKEKLGVDPRSIFTNIQFIPKLSLKDELDREILYRGMLCSCDWVYEDIDRIYEIFSGLNSDESNLLDEITNFVEYAAGKFGMTSDEAKILDYIIQDFDWDNPQYCIERLLGNASIEVAKFLQKYNFTLSIGVVYDK